ncbi:class I SAM-dependent methyltransferase [Wenzhouxiangella sp. EGI_FJ10305]|uniref:class I SAM-dependent methyltransferase n=1 Tax=Wenzhouxiangella sp. EGI_FJ10305 TaxID=3243768 RepID=UPI0035E00AE1
MKALRTSGLAISALMLVAPALADEKLKSIIESDDRPAAEAERDQYRNPYETLTFFGIEPDMTVVEISPGSGWYTEILGPYLAGEGQLVAAHWNMEQEELPGYYEPGMATYKERISAERFGEVEIIAFDPPEMLDLGEPGSADMVLTFRNVHSYAGDDTFRDVAGAAFEVLKPGGVFGVVGHRLPEDGEQDPGTGYVKQSWVVGIAESSGFVLEEASETNANPDDTADHPNGVWTLPPSLRVPEGEDEEKYREIGESDRFTLKFVKR